MTGEITITGKVLPIGGLKEKLYAAKRIGVKTVIIPEKNTADIHTFPPSLKRNLNLVPVAAFEDVLKTALLESN